MIEDAIDLKSLFVAAIELAKRVNILDKEVERLKEIIEKMEPDV